MAHTACKVFDELDARDPERAQTALILVDGDAHQLEQVLAQAKARKRRVRIVADLLHVLHYVWNVAAVLFDKATQRANWVQVLLLTLLCHPPERMLETLVSDVAARSLTGADLATAKRAMAYLEKRIPYIDYRECIEKGWPIATGVIEGACRYLIQDRLGITGARWSVAGAQTLLKLRAIQKSGHWEEYWRFHMKQEAGRNHPPTAMAA